MKIKINDMTLLKLTFLIAAIIVVFQVLKLESIMSMLFYLLFVVVLIFWVLTIKDKLKKNDILIIFLMLVSLVSTLYNVTQYRGAVDFEYFKKLIMFFSAIVFLQTMSKCKINRETEQFILNINSLLILFLVTMYLMFKDQMYVYNNINVKYVTFHFSNPNLLGLFLTCMTMIEAARIFEKKWRNKLFHAGLTLIMIYLVAETESRNCLLALVVFGITIIIVGISKKKDYQINNLVSTFIAIFPLIFVILYMFFIESDWLKDIFSFISSEQKTLASRWEVWRYGIENIKESPLFGTYNNISIEMGLSHFHNSHLDVMASYGIVVFGLFCTFLCNIVSCFISNDKKAFIFQIGFCCVLLLGIGEAAIFSGGLSLFVFAGVLRVLANREMILTNE